MKFSRVVQLTKLYNVSKFNWILFSRLLSIMGQKPWYGAWGMILHNIVTIHICCQIKFTIYFDLPFKLCLVDPLLCSTYPRSNPGSGKYCVSKKSCQSFFVASQYIKINNILRSDSSLWTKTCPPLIQSVNHV